MKPVDLLIILLVGVLLFCGAYYMRHGQLPDYKKFIAQARQAAAEISNEEPPVSHRQATKARQPKSENTQQAIPAMEGEEINFDVSYPQSAKAEDLFKNLLPVVKKILEKQDALRAKTGAYTPYFGELGLKIPYISSYYKAEGKETITLGPGGLYLMQNNGQHLALHCTRARTPQEYYYLKFDFGGKAYCMATQEEGQGACVALGGTNPKTDLKAIRTKIYTLPDDFLSFGG